MWAWSWGTEKGRRVWQGQAEGEVSKALLLGAIFNRVTKTQ